jgi:hypothetical protein
MPKENVYKNNAHASLFDGEMDFFLVKIAALRFLRFVINISIDL